MFVPEPVTLVSTCVGILGFVVTTALSTIERAQLTYETARDYRSKLETNRIIVQACHLRLDAWYEHWSPSTDSAHAIHPDDLWGPQGVQRIQRLLANIADVAQRIQSKIADEVPEKHQARWRVITERILRTGALQWGEHEGGLKSKAAEICERVAYALYKSAALKEPVSSLEVLVGSLDVVAKDLVIQRHGRYRACVPSDKQGLRRMIFADRSHGRVTDALQLAYERLNCNDHEIWTLICQRLDSDAEFSLEAFADVVPIEFLKLHESFTRHKKGRWIDAPIALAEMEDVNVYAHSLRERDQILGDCAPVYILRDSIKHLFEMIARSSTAIRQDEDLGVERLKKNFAQAIELLRFQTAISLAASVTLFYDTHWIDPLCSCQVRHAARHDDEDDICVVVSASTGHDGPNCHHPEFYDNPDLLLGLALVELAIARPVCMRRDSESGEARYQIYDGEESSSNVECVSHATLLIRVQRETSSVQYMYAVEYCLASAQGLKTFNSATEVSRAYERHVVRPLEQAYKDRAKIYESHAAKLAGYNRYWKDRFNAYLQNGV